MTNGRTWGLILAILVCILSGYEAIGIAVPGVPTISRVLQGWRDGPGSNLWVWLCVFLIISLLNLFSAWLFHHLLFEPRSGL
jgi:hypothetical protein